MFYEARVLNNIDPEQKGKLLVSIIETHGINIAGEWAKACLPSRSFQLPAVGEFVWVAPLRQDMTELIWFGWHPRHSMQDYVGQISEAYGDQGTYKFGVDESGNGDPQLIEEEPPQAISTPDRFTPMKTPGGITFWGMDDLKRTRNTDKTFSELSDKKESIRELSEEDNFNWGMEDPMGNIFLIEQVDGKTYFRLRTNDGNSKGFEISHNTAENIMQIFDTVGNFLTFEDGQIELYFTKDDKTHKLRLKGDDSIFESGANKISLLKDKIVIDSGGKEILVGGADATHGIAFGDKIDKYLVDLDLELKKWVPVPMDGGASLKVILTVFSSTVHSLRDLHSKNNKVN